MPGPPQVTADEHPDSVHVELCVGRPEDVSGTPQLHAHAAGQLHAPTVRHGLEEVERPLCVRGVEQRKGGSMSRVARQVGVRRFLLLDPRSVAEHDRDQLCRGRRAHHPAAVAVTDEHGEVAAVVEVGMCEDHRTDTAGVRTDVPPVALPPGLLTLEQPAVDQDPGVVALEQEPAPGHRAGRTQEGQGAG